VEEDNKIMHRGEVGEEIICESCSGVYCERCKKGGKRCERCGEAYCEGCVRDYCWGGCGCGEIKEM